jgi:hypothetical protein
MQLIIIVFAAFGLGYWFSRSNGVERLTDATKNIGSRLRRKPKTNQVATTEGQDQSNPEAETA